MIRTLAALIFLSALTHTIDVPDKMSLSVADLGGNLTLTCAVSQDKAGLFYWYRLRFGYMVETVAAGTFEKITLEKQFDSSRFTVSKDGGLYFLNIANISKEDEGTYLCQGGSAYVMKFTNSSVVVVNDHKNLQRSVYVKQKPETQSVQLGDLMTLQCSLVYKDKETADQCPGEHDVYWFRAGLGESQPSVIYTHGDTSNEDEERSCVYSLSKTFQKSSDSGMYYCAVVTCGRILFGEGTKVEPRQELFPLVVVLGALLVCTLIVTAALIICRNQSPVHEHCNGDLSAPNQGVHHRSAEDQLRNTNDDTLALNYVALNFPARKARGWTNNRQLSQDCAYS